ncbi:MAG: hypothetical protein R2706_07500 [Acidimicrobiales bacterium]
MIPIGLVLHAEKTDGVANAGAAPTPESVIDLRDRANAKFKAHTADLNASEA